MVINRLRKYDFFLCHKVQSRRFLSLNLSLNLNLNLNLPGLSSQRPFCGGEFKVEGVAAESHPDGSGESLEKGFYLVMVIISRHLHVKVAAGRVGE